MVTTTQLQNYRNIHNTIEKGDVQRTPFEGTIPQITKSCHSTLKRVRMTVNHPTISNIKLVIF